MEWNETTIRQELARMDRITGLKGAALQIFFTKGRLTLGQYSFSGGESTFRFSDHFFQDPTWPVEEALDTIRHEYAHYMDHMLYGKFGHGPTWKKCCGVVGAFPVRLYDRQRAKYYKDKHAKEDALSARCDAYRVGDRIEHPRFGTGTILNIAGEAAHRWATVAFESEGEKKLALSWVDQNCRKSCMNGQVMV